MKFFPLFLAFVYGAGVHLSISLSALASVLICLLALWMVREAEAPLRNWFIVSWVLVGFQAIRLTYDWEHSDLEALRGLYRGVVPAAAAIVFARMWDSMRDKNVWKNTLLWFLTACLTASVLAALWKMLRSGEPGSGFLGNPIYFAYSLLPVFVFCLENWRKAQKQNQSRGVFVFGTLIALSGILLSQSRMVWLVTFVVFALRAPYGDFLRSRKTSLVLGLLVLGAGFAVWRQPQFQEKLDRTMSLASDPSWQWRTKAWDFNWKMFKENPIFGVGTERNAIDVAHDTDLAGHWLPGHKIFAHSIYLQTLSEGGIALVGILAIWGLLALTAAPSIWPLALAFLLSGLTENILNNAKAAHAWLFYCALFVCLSRKSSKE